MADPGQEEACAGCGLVLPSRDGPTHPYLGTNPACWALYGELLAREFGDPDYFNPAHALTVHAYAVQHPGEPGRRSRQSVALHLSAICMVVERRVAIPDSTRLMQGIAVRDRDDLPWLEPPKPNGTVTVRDVLAAESPAEHEQAVRRWAADLWTAWQAHHATVRTWVAETLER